MRISPPTPRSPRPLLAGFAAAVLISGCAGVPAAPPAADTALVQTPANIERGQYLAQRECSQCHAVALSGESPAPMAPPFRRLAAGVGGPALEGRLLRVSELGHYEMPRAGLERADIRDLAVYIESLD